MRTCTVNFVIVVACIYGFVGSCLNAKAQIFSKVTSVTNPIVTDPVQTFYAGASWIDFDNDGRLDLFVVRGGLYHNNGNGNFSKITGSGLGLTTGVGNTWADVDNDGDIDCIQSDGDNKGTKLFTNNGNSTFTQNTSSVFSIPTNLRGWGSAFGDYNNDGLIDLFIASPFGYLGVTDSCKFLVNNGNGNFARVDSTVITDTLDSFTIPSWSDYDNDGDIDLFIGAGRVNGSISTDYLFNNNHSQTGNTLFSRNNSAPLGTDLHDGQIWNWIDFDNDGDLDAFVTNYLGTGTSGYQNEMYRNDITSFAKLTGVDVGAIVTDADKSLSNTWGDFDNDGDLDCIVTNEGLQKNVFYRNNIKPSGSTVFTKVINEPFTLNNGDHFCATSADYDNDGDLDLFISANSDKGLYENITSPLTDFINLKLVGLVTNRSAIGAKVRVLAHGYWQMREVSSQNTFGGMNMLNVHFGFGFTGPVALIIDTIKIEWPSGIVDVCTNIYAGAFYTATEGQCLTPTGLINNGMSSNDFFHVSVFPNPAEDKLSFNYQLLKSALVEASIIDSNGKTILFKTLSNSLVGHNTEVLNIKNLSSGIYSLILKSENLFAKTKFVKK